jgi:hypothetical protein
MAESVVVIIMKTAVEEPQLVRVDRRVRFVNEW